MLPQLAVTFHGACQIPRAAIGLVRVFEAGKGNRLDRLMLTRLQGRSKPSILCVSVAFRNVEKEMADSGQSSPTGHDRHLQPTFNRASAICSSRPFVLHLLDSLRTWHEESSGRFPALRHPDASPALTGSMQPTHPASWFVEIARNRNRLICRQVAIIPPGRRRLSRTRPECHEPRLSESNARAIW